MRSVRRCVPADALALTALYTTSVCLPVSVPFCVAYDRGVGRAHRPIEICVRRAPTATVATSRPSTSTAPRSSGSSRHSASTSVVLPAPVAPTYTERDMNTHIRRRRHTRTHTQTSTGKARVHVRERGRGGRPKDGGHAYDAEPLAGPHIQSDVMQRQRKLWRIPHTHRTLCAPSPHTHMHMHRVE
jgi:hypothetical protein